MKNGRRVFIAGSRRLSRLSPEVRRRIDRIVDRDFTVIVGDANGADKAVQQYLKNKNYDNVIVFCMKSGCRNNLGAWPVRTISAADFGRRDFAYYSSKDRAMVNEADYGLMLWDGQSRGTLTNIVHLVREGRPVVVYLASQKCFETLREHNQLAELLNRFDSTLLQRVDRDLGTVKTQTASNGRAGTALLF